MNFKPVVLTPIQTEIRTHLPTGEAARWLGREAQTLRVWASRDAGPIRAARIGGRLAWPVAEIRKVLGVSA